ncbi:DUF481 domain-containing protein [Hydrogenovibrio sp. SC-1]|uniref:DUF481 domain-containing protein n=1 Tax=Hydrogenovibrio sp. SC-1 TaxID=2065820 RepID=UPI000C79E1B1|nr:DUF481 domain-containing protein [Hydrogenovibrio sp. SC-1]PLA75454.1 DUF481 domain-containing protein [Hydrogenovibrio sp. SC-1]
MNKNVLLLALGSTLITQPVLAEDEPKHGLSGAGEAGYANTTGNVISESMYAALTADYKQTDYRLKGLVEAKNKSEDKVATEERYVGEVQADWFLNAYPQAYGFGQVRLENDRFVDIDLNTYLLAGMGYSFYDETDLILATEVGLGRQTTNYANASGQKDLSQSILKASANFEYGFNQNVRFLQDIAVYSGSDQMQYETNTGIKVKLNGSLSLKANNKIRHNDTPAAGNVKKDTETFLTLIYDF